jgi:hypothetical protein
LDSSIPVEIEIEEDALLNKTETDPNSTKEKRSKRILLL